MPRSVIGYDLEETYPSPHTGLMKRIDAFAPAKLRGTRSRIPPWLVGELPDRNSAKQSFDGAVEMTRAAIGKCKCRARRLLRAMAHAAARSACQR